MKALRYKDVCRLVTLVTIEDDKHRLVHVAAYATLEGSRPKKKQVYYLHFICGKKRTRGTFKHLGMESRRFPTCIRCAAEARYVRTF